MPKPSRRYLLEGRALDPERQRLLLVLPGLELRSPRAVVAPVFCLLYGIACFSDAHHSSFTMPVRTKPLSSGPCLDFGRIETPHRFVAIGARHFADVRNR